MNPNGKDQRVVPWSLAMTGSIQAMACFATPKTVALGIGNKPWSSIKSVSALHTKLSSQAKYTIFTYIPRFSKIPICCSSTLLSRHSAQSYSAHHQSHQICSYARLDLIVPLWSKAVQIPRPSLSAATMQTLWLRLHASCVENP